MILVMVVNIFAARHHENAASLLGVTSSLLISAVIALLLLAMMLVMAPLNIRASLTQDFGKSFDLQFIKQFLALTWREAALSMLFVGATSVLFSFCDLIEFCVGIYCANVLIYFTWTHLHKQLYALYLSRGGEPVPASPKLGLPASPA